MNAKLTVVTDQHGTIQTIAISFRPSDCNGGDVVDGRMVSLAFDADRGCAKPAQCGWTYTDYPTYSPGVGVTDGNDKALYFDLNELSGALARLSSPESPAVA